MAKSDMPEFGQLFQIPPAKSGIYFLWHEGEVVYVGQAKDVSRRTAQHVNERVKIFDSFSFLPCDVGRLDQTERHYIEKLAPKYNNCGIAKIARMMKAQGAAMPPAIRERRKRNQHRTQTAA